MHARKNAFEEALWSRDVSRARGNLNSVQTFPEYIDLRVRNAITIETTGFCLCLHYLLECPTLFHAYAVGALEQNACATCLSLVLSLFMVAMNALH